MKKILLIIAVVFLVIVIFIQYKNKSNKKIDAPTITYTLNNKTYKLLVARTSAEHEKGLMYYHKLIGADGMIFIFPDKNYRTFWNKNTYLNLDVYWIKDDKVIGKDFLPAIEKNKELTVITSQGVADKVIEIVSY